jgi:hypothetical protein
MTEFWHDLGLPGARLGGHAFDYIALCREHYAKVGLGADFVDQFIR